MHVAYNHYYTVILFATERDTTNTANNLTCNTLQNHTRVECTHQNHPYNMQRSMHGPFTSSHGMKSFNLMPRCLKPHDVEYGGTQVNEIRLQTTDAATKPHWCDDLHHQTQRAGSSQGTTNGWSLHSNDAANCAKLLCFGNVAWCVGMERWWMVPFIPTACFGQISPSSFNNTNSWNVTTEIGYHHRTCWLPNDTRSCQSTAVNTSVQCLGPPKGTCMNAMPPALRAQQSIA